jgi:hypothetical protein
VLRSELVGSANVRATRINELVTADACAGRQRRHWTSGDLIQFVHIEPSAEPSAQCKFPGRRHMTEDRFPY